MLPELLQLEGLNDLPHLPAQLASADRATRIACVQAPGRVHSSKVFIPLNQNSAPR
ncbi:hypothetical protein [Geopsychrobacter electrodiphilus]|uniref:hypothetical protein n=1 Tax=Geopsychrobacter electrodiphilus TaxID=225196 RepID=UPI00035DBAFE|nr:hypothetical protein [Geopsychrobacter electrodiphilus]